MRSSRAPLVAVEVDTTEIPTCLGFLTMQPTQNLNVRDLIPLGRVATAEEIAGPVLFLASDLASHVNGEILNVNGGSVLCG
jgi:3-oxoacyl-[acyl-carrier protein] reductase